MQTERPVLTCSRSFSTSCSESTGSQKWTHHQKAATVVANDNNNNNGNSVFDFSFDCGAESVTSPISADQIFHNGKIKPTLPLPNHLFFQETVIERDPKREKKEGTGRRNALRLLFLEDREPASSLSSFSNSSSSSLSSSEIDEHDSATTVELDSLPADTYCVWKPKSVEENNAKIKRGEGSSGSLSRRWRLMDLLTRNSGGGGGGGGDKNSSSTSKRHEDDKKKTVKKIGASGRKSAELPPPSTTRKEGEAAGGEKKRMSYFPYRQELVGIFGSSNGSRNQQR